MRDSNPRDGSPPTHFPGVRLRPLGQLSLGVLLPSRLAVCKQEGGAGGECRAVCLRKLQVGWSVGKADRHATVLAALFLDLAHGYTADFAGPGDMGATTGLQVDLACPLTDPDQPHPALAFGRMD